MCRLFGMSAGAERAKATFWLLDAPDSLTVQSHREPDGTGLGWFDEHERPELSKQPLAAYGDRDFATRAREVSSRTFVAHIRFASTGGLELRNTHPFEQAGRLFAHNGVIEDLPALERRAGHIAATGRGGHRLRALLRPDHPRDRCARRGRWPAASRRPARWVAANLPLLSINFVLATAGELWALRYPETHELHMLERAPGSPLEHASSLGSRVRSAHGAEHPMLTIASEPMDEDPGWRALESGELVHVGPQLEVDSQRILEGPPAKPLTLADLTGHARASQAKAP